MAKLPVYNKSGKEVGSYQIEPTDLAPQINRQLLHDAVVMYQTNQRQGSAKTKTRSEIRGSTRKLYRQKGTGNARQGSRKQGVRRGGGHIHARKPRDWTYRLPRKALQAATRMAVASKIEDEQITIIDELAFEEPKTRDMAAILKALNIDETSVLVTVEGHNENVWKSARNIPRVNVSPAADLNALSVLQPRRLLVTKAALDWIKQKAAGEKTSA